MVTLDGQYGPQTERAVKDFQELVALPQSGKVEPESTFPRLSQPMDEAFHMHSEPYEEHPILHFAQQQLRQKPRELNNRNEGPWVRSYMDGNEGSPWAWCMGFVQTVLDQATSSMGKSFRDIMPQSYSCDVVGNHGLTMKKLHRNKELRSGHYQPQPGDIFLNVRTAWDWVHTGFVTGTDGDWLLTIEGNTNDEGSREGFEVCRRMRNFMNHDIDVFEVRLAGA